MTEKSEIGDFGENLACDYLKSNRYSIIERNFRKPWGEIDIVCRAPDGTLVFVEVKTMTPGDIRPEENVTQSKLHKMKKAAMLYAGHRPNLVSERNGWRIDVVTVLLADEEDERPKINHYENVG